jgi:Serine carboxypeptidase
LIVFLPFYSPATGPKVPRTSAVPNGYACGGPTAQVEWLGKSEVKAALNVPEEANFFQCDNGVGFTYNITEVDLVSWYKEVIAENKLRIMVYNGE